MPWKKSIKIKQLTTGNLVQSSQGLSSILPSKASTREEKRASWELESSANRSTGLEMLPNIDHYTEKRREDTNLEQRPTLYELRERRHSSTNPLEDTKVIKAKLQTGATKFGWIKGVLVRCLLNIFGVMLFLRLSWVTAHAGIGLTSIIILLAAVVTIITTLSMSAICTNGEVKGGGCYYMISRSLGPEFGGAIGIIFSVANAVAASMYVVGFAETVVKTMREHNAQIVDDELNDVRIIGCVTCVLVVGIIIVGMEWEAKAQLVLLAILVVAIVNFVVGTFLTPTKEERDKGFVGYSGGVFGTNFGPDFRKEARREEEETFFSVFSVFFPAATGILAGANISGDLKNPQTAIPKGTLLAIILTTLVYLILAWICGATLARDAFLVDVDESMSNMTPTPHTLDSCTSTPNCTLYGSHHDYGVISVASAFGPLILAGIFSATISSALASMVGAPKVFQAVCVDRVFPGISFFAKGYGANNDPRRAYVLAFIICLGMTCVAELNIIAPIISNFFLMAYTLINFACFDASMAKTPGFRPAFKYYNQWLSLVGAVLCLAVMFIINWWAALITFAVCTGLYMYIHHTKPDVNWGSSTQARVYQDALRGCQKLTGIEEHVKNFRPQLLVLTGNPKHRPELVDFCGTVSKNQSLLVCCHVMEDEILGEIRRWRTAGIHGWLKSRHIKAFYINVTANCLREGTKILMQTVGMGKLRPNTVFVGYKNNWHTCSYTDVHRYTNIIRDAFDLCFCVAVMRIEDGFDRTEDTGQNSGEGQEKTVIQDEVALNIDSWKMNYDEDEEEQNKANGDIPAEKSAETTTAQQPVSPIVRMLSAFAKAENDDTRVSRFQEKQTGTIDVWWLFDDGGLTLLLPYILSTRSRWKNCKLRVFCGVSLLGSAKQEEESMKDLLQKFRINYSELTVLSELNQRPANESINEFEQLMEPWRLQPGENAEDFTWKTSDAELGALKFKSYRYLRLRELFKIHSKDAALIVATLPMPRRNSVKPGLYMAWLEMMTRDMPPILLIRGNQQSALTFYS